MNQILYKGNVYGGVGEDVTNRPGSSYIGNVLFNFTGGENSERFNSYRGSGLNIAEGKSSTIIGFNNIEAKVTKDNNGNWVKDNSNDLILKNNFIGGENNIIGSNSENNLIFGNGLQTTDNSNTLIIGQFNKNVADAKFIIGNGTATTAANRNNAFVIKNDGTQFITLKNKTLSDTLGIGEIEITQEKIRIVSLNKENNQKKIVEFTFEDLEKLKTLSQVQNINDTQFPQT